MSSLWSRAASQYGSVSASGLGTSKRGDDMASILRKPEQTLRDDIALHFARPARDRQTPVGQEGTDPGRRVTIVGRALRAEQAEPDLLHTLIVFDPEQLSNTRLGTGI